MDVKYTTKMDVKYTTASADTGTGTGTVAADTSATATARTATATATARTATATTTGIIGGSGANSYQRKRPKVLFLMLLLIASMFLITVALSSYHLSIPDKKNVKVVGDVTKVYKQLASTSSNNINININRKQPLPSSNDSRKNKPNSNINVSTTTATKPSPSPSSIPSKSVSWSQIESLFNLGLQNPSKLVSLLSTTDIFDTRNGIDNFTCPSNNNSNSSSSSNRNSSSSSDISSTGTSSSDISSTGTLDYPNYIYNKKSSDEFKNSNEDSFLFYQHLRKAGGTSFCDFARSNMPRKFTPGYYCMPDNKGIVPVLFIKYRRIRVYYITHVFFTI